MTGAIEKFELNILQQEDIPDVVRVHMEELPGFLTKLGRDFLEKYYKESLKVPELFTITVSNKNGISGFATGTLSTEGLNKKIIKRNPHGFVLEVMKYFFAHPSDIGKLVRTLTYPGFTDDDPELLTIAISKKSQGKGLGKKLFREISLEMKNRGKEKFLVSVYDRLPANGFYLNMGCTFLKSFDFLGERMNYYEYRIKK